MKLYLIARNIESNNSDASYTYKAIFNCIETLSVLSKSPCNDSLNIF